MNNDISIIIIDKRCSHAPIANAHTTTMGCTHRWKTTHSLPQEDALHRIRYHKCLRCGLRVKTEERLAVPWDEGTIMAVVAQAFPQGVVADAAMLREQGLLGGGLVAAQRAPRPPGLATGLGAGPGADGGRRATANPTRGAWRHEHAAAKGMSPCARSARCGQRERRTTMGVFKKQGSIG